MPRSLDPTFQEALTGRVIRPAFFLQLTFRSETLYLWSGVGPYPWNGQTWTGTGSLGAISQISEGSDLQAYGTAVTLSGIDSNLMSEAMNDIELGAPANLYLALFDQNKSLIGSPALVFGGQVDKASFSIGPETSSITLNLESPMIRLQVVQGRRFTDADQRLNFADDCAFQWQPQLNFMALRWGF